MNAQHAKQLWTNLLSNAVKYTPKGGRVSVSLEKQDGCLVGSVQDTGIGISEEADNSQMVQRGAKSAAR